MSTWIPEGFPSLSATHRLPASLCSVLNLHPDRRGFTCVAHAISKGRRCQNKIDVSNRKLATAIIAETNTRMVQGEDPEVVWKSTLERLAPLIVCERHVGQVGDIMMRWACVLAEFYAGHHGGPTWNDWSPRAVLRSTVNWGRGCLGAPARRQ